MGRPNDVLRFAEKQGNAMKDWKDRQRERPMQGPPTELQMLRAEIEALKRQRADDQMAAALTELEHYRARIRL